MLTEDQLKHVAHSRELARSSQREIVLLILAVIEPAAKGVQIIREIGLRAGIRLRKWNLPSILSKADRLAIKTDVGWELSPSGRQVVRDLVAKTDFNLVIGIPSKALSDHAKSIKNSDSAAFVREAIVCFEARQYRASVVLSWVGAMSVLHQNIVKNHLAAFNTEAARRDHKWRAAKTADDLGRMKEHDFLDIADAIGVIGKNVKQALQNNCLQLRNACGHPNSLKIAEHAVAAHLELLMLNVFSKY